MIFVVTIQVIDSFVYLVVITIETLSAINYVDRDDSTTIFQIVVIKPWVPLLEGDFLCV